MHLPVSTLPHGVVCVKLSGRLDIDHTLKLEDPFAFQVATQKQPVVVDLAEVEFLASIAMRLLLKNAKALQGRGGKLVLLKPSVLVREALTISGIATLIPVFDDLDSACQAAVKGMAP